LTVAGNEPVAFAQFEIAVVGCHLSIAASHNDFGFPAASNIDAIQPVILKQHSRNRRVDFEPVECAARTTCLDDGDAIGHLELDRGI
jgi:hypothetical protein